jgi:hypothetical protein
LRLKKGGSKLMRAMHLQLPNKVSSSKRKLSSRHVQCLRNLSSSSRKRAQATHRAKPMMD